MENKDFAVFILTHGRAGNVITYKTLKRAGYTGKIYLIIDDEDKEADRYIEEYGDRVVVFSKAKYAEVTDTLDNFGNMNVVVYARNATFDIAEELGVKYFWVLDDDYTSFSYCFDGDGNFKRKTVKNMDKVLDILLEYYINTPKIDSLAIAQGGDMIGGIENSKVDAIKLTRKVMNSFLCSTDRRFKFMGTINEDTNMYTLLGSTGRLFFTTFLFMLNQKQTQSNEGGLTDIYLDLGTYVKSFYTIMLHPSSVKIRAMGNHNMRLHHNIDWNRTVPKILREG